jgi:hypothetical protein
MEDELYATVFKRWMFSTMLPDPLDDLVQLPPTAGIPDGFYHIKRAFLKEEATDLLSPDSYVSKGYGLSSEQRKLYDWAESEDQVAEAFRVEPKLRSMTLMQEKKPRTRSYLAK